MALRLYNTLSRGKEPFQPSSDNPVTIYVCGITAYDVCHMGHARSAVVFDVLVRYLRWCGHDVVFVKNFTDVDDKIIQKAGAQGVEISAIAERYIREHDADMDALGIDRPTFAPRATEHIADMIRLVAVLLDKGLAYEAGGDVYFDVAAFPGYGRLSKRNLEEMLAGARVEVNERKRNPLDFALWKESKPGEPRWESPWGRGRPGWHIECSAMSQRFLGETFDIHGGGEDLIFPHHENEIAQSEGATGRLFARYWLHNGFVRVDREKMSKSLGNFFTIKEALQRHHPEVLRLFMLQSHYRSPVDFNDTALAEARQGMERLYATLQALQKRAGSAQEEDAAGDSSVPPAAEPPADRILAGLRTQFREAMDDDLNTAKAIGHLFEAVRSLNAILPLTGALRASGAAAAMRTMVDLGAVLGILQVDPEAYALQDRNREARKRGIDVDRIDALVKERQEARRARQWERADALRHALAREGILLQDGPSGTLWRIA